MFITVSVKTALSCKQSKCPSMGELEHPFNGLLLSNEEEWPTDTCNNTDEFQSMMLREINQTLRLPTE